MAALGSKALLGLRWKPWVLSSPKAGTCMHTQSRYRLKHTNQRHFQQPLHPAVENIHLSFCLYLPLAAQHLNPHPTVGESTTGWGPPSPLQGYRARCLASLTRAAGAHHGLLDAAPAGGLIHRVSPPGSVQGPGVPCVATSSRCSLPRPCRFWLHTQLSTCVGDYVSNPISFQWIPSLTWNVLLTFAIKNPDCILLLYHKPMPAFHPPTINRSYGLFTNLEPKEKRRPKELLEMKIRERGWPVPKCKSMVVGTEVGFLQPTPKTGLFTRITSISL